MQKESAETAANRLNNLPAGERYMVAFPQVITEDKSLETEAQRLREDGFIRWIVDGQVLTTDQQVEISKAKAADDSVFVVVDRLTAGKTAEARVRESLETAMSKGDGRCHVFVPGENGAAKSIAETLFPEQESVQPCPSMVIDGKTWVRIGFSNQLVCEDCGEEFPRLLSLIHI